MSAPATHEVSKPFVLIGTRAESEAADAEYQAILDFGGLTPERFIHIRAEAGELEPLNLDDYAGIIVGGSPFNASYPPEKQTDIQQQVEAQLYGLLDDVVARDFPFLGICYGIGLLGTHQGGVVDATFAEPVSSVEVTVNAEGKSDPLLAGVPETFTAYVGHKEAISKTPESAVVLASSPTSPVHMLRVKSNIYATQFHPELDAEGLCARITIYQNYGYFDPSETEILLAQTRASTVTAPRQVLRNFVTRYGKQ